MRKWKRDFFSYLSNTCMGLKRTEKNTGLERSVSTF